MFLRFQRETLKDKYNGELHFDQMSYSSLETSKKENKNKKKNQTNSVAENDRLHF